MPIKGLEWTFDTVSEEYDKWRPGYIPKLFSDIFLYTNIFPGIMHLKSV